MKKQTKPKRIIDAETLTFKDKMNPILFMAWLKQENEIAMFVFPQYKIFFDKAHRILNRKVFASFAQGIFTFLLLSFIFKTIYDNVGMDFVLITIAVYFFFSLGQVISLMHGFNVGIRELTEEVKKLDL